MSAPGAGHYREAEWLLAQVTRPSAISPDHHVLSASEFPGDSPADVIALAQVEATLAFARELAELRAVIQDALAGGAQ